MAGGKKRRKVKRAILEAKEPLSLLETLKEEGMANAMMLFSMASEAAKHLKPDAIKPQLKEFLSTMGYASRGELEQLHARIEELEDRIAELEEQSLGDEE